MNGESTEDGAARAPDKGARRGGLSVGLKLGVIAAASTAVVLGATALLLDRHLNGQFIRLLSETSAEESEAIRSVLEEQMKTGDRSLLNRLVADMGRERGIAWIGILDKDGRVRASSDPARADRRFEVTSPECRGCHARSPATRGRTTTLVGHDGAVVRTVTPIENRAPCRTCHGDAGTLNGIFIIDRPLAPVGAALAASRTRIVVGGAAALVVLLASLWFAADRLVLRRLRGLRLAARALGGRELGAPEVSSDDRTDDLRRQDGDEVEALTEEFTWMADRLSRQREDIRRRDEERVRLLERLISAQEEQRARIARDLHDGIGQTLSALLLRLRAGQGDGRGTDAGALEEKVAASIEEIRRLAADLRPSVLDDYGLKAAITRHLDEVVGRSGCAFAFTVAPEDGLDARLDPAAEVVLYRVTQEAVTNVVRHAAAQKASVIVYRRPDSVTLLVEDDGTGFDLQSAAPAAGGRRLGIAGMRERVELLGGSFVVESTPGAGTTVRATIPAKG